MAQRRNFTFPRPVRGTEEIVKAGLADNLRSLEAWIAANQDTLVQDGEKLVFLDGDGNDEWYWQVGTTDNLELYDTSGSLRAVWSVSGGYKQYDDDGNLVFEYDDTNQQFEFSPNPSNLAAKIDAIGLLVDDDVDAVPLGGYQNTGSHTLSAASTYERVGSLVLMGLATTGPRFTVTASGSVQFLQNASTTHRDAYARIRISTDGGSTWTSGPISRVSGMASDEMPRATVAVVGGASAFTPTGSVQLELEVQVSHTEMTVATSGFVWQAFGFI